MLYNNILIFLLKIVFFLILFIAFFIYTEHVAINVYAQNELNTVNVIKKNTESFQLNTTDTLSCISNMQNTNTTTINIVDISSDPIISTSIAILDTQPYHATDAADYLQNIPGFSIIRNGGTNNNLVFRGMSNSQIRIIMDNSELIGACSSHMDPSSAYIISETFDILNIIKGPQTVLWGSVSPGGILQFQRYHPNFYEPKIQLHSNITFGSHNNISRNIDSILGNKNGYIRLIGNLAHSDNYRDSNHCQVHSAWYKWNADTILSYNIHANTHIELNLGQGNGCANYATKPMDGLCFARESYGFKTEIMDINDLLSKIEIQTWVHQIHHIMVDNKSNISKKLPNTDIVKHCCFNKNINNAYRFLWGARNIINYQYNNIRFYSGADTQINKHKKNITKQHLYQKDSCITDTGIFTEAIVDLLSNRKLIGGFRLGYNTANIYNDNYIILCKHRKIYPAGFIRYETNVKQSLLYYIGMGTSQCFLDYWKLISNQFYKNKQQISKITQIKPEKITQIDFGIHFKKPKIDGWISSYTGYIKDFIHYDNDNQNECVQNNFLYNLNNHRAKICGSEMGLTYKISDYWYGKSNISWSWGLNTDTHCILSTIPPVEGKLACQFRNKTYTVEAMWRLVSSSESINKILSFAHSHSSIFSSKDHTHTAGFGVFFVHVNWFISKYHTYSFGVHNLFNKNYIEYLNTFNYKTTDHNNLKPIPEPGRTWWFKTEIKF